MQHTCGTIQKLARNRQKLRSFIAALRATRHDGQESECAITIVGHFFSLLLHVLVYTKYGQAYPDEIVVIIVAKMVIMYIVAQTIIQIVMIVIRVAL